MTQTATYPRRLKIGIAGIDRRGVFLKRQVPVPPDYDAELDLPAAQPSPAY